MSISENIKKFRELSDISRKEMASKLELSLSAYGKIERGETDITVSKIVKIAQILNIDLERLMNFEVSQIFNISGKQNLQDIAPKAENINFYADDYKEKYIKMLEVENERLKLALS